MKISQNQLDSVKCKDAGGGIFGESKIPLPGVQGLTLEKKVNKIVKYSVSHLNKKNKMLERCVKMGFLSQLHHL